MNYKNLSTLDGINFRSISDVRRFIEEQERRYPNMTREQYLEMNKVILERTSTWR